jgi:hypothetical protein
MKKIPESFELDELDIKLAIEYWIKGLEYGLPLDAKCSIILSTANFAENGAALSDDNKRILAKVTRV